jgi:hypothetical protein
MNCEHADIKRLFIQNCLVTMCNLMPNESDELLTTPGFPEVGVGMGLNKNRGKCMV